MRCRGAYKLVEVVVGVVNRCRLIAGGAGFLSTISGIIILVCDRLQRGVALFDGVAGKAVVGGVGVVNVPGFIASCFGFVCDVASGVVGEGVCYEDGTIVIFCGLIQDAARIVVREGGDGTGDNSGDTILIFTPLWFLVFPRAFGTPFLRFQGTVELSFQLFHKGYVAQRAASVFVMLQFEPLGFGGGDGQVCLPVFYEFR